ncbi:MAG TPA: GH116 family glycosyl hydrolase [Verrucomicrobiae bacterium]|nr:GH116 family glycosyl hydrolase [Verrucomicrobiae bacterium]
MPKPAAFDIRDIYTITGTEVATIYEKNKMAVHFQGMSKTLQFPQTVALQGAPTCSIGISPHGLYNRLNDAGRLIMLNQKTVQFGSAPFVRIGDKLTMLTQAKPGASELPEDVPAIKNYYPPAIDEKNVSLTIATPSMEMAFKIGKVTVTRRLISPLLSGNEQTLMPIGVEEFEVQNASNQSQTITLVVPKPSLVNLQEKELKPTDQDSVYISSAPVHGHVHEAFESNGVRGIVMGSTESPNRMVLAVAETPGVAIDVQPYFCLNRLVQDLLLNGDGSFFEKRKPILRSDYGSAISLTFTVKAKATRKIAIAVALDFPEQVYIDGTKFERKYVRNFKDAGSRAMDLARLALDSYPQWWEKTVAIQKRIFDSIQASASYKGDRAGALRLTRLILNELHFPLSNAIVWVEDEKNGERARFLECFDYAYIDPSDVDWYSMVLLMLFPRVEKDLCQGFVDSILAEDPTPRFYHQHASFIEARKHYLEHPEEYEGVSMTQIRDAFKTKGSVAHDLGAMPKGHPLRNVSDYAWYNNNYWVDLFPKLMMRVLRNVKFTGDIDFLRQNWKTLKFGLESLLQLDFDDDGLPEGYPDEVKNTFDNLVLFGADAYDATQFLGGCQAMIKMAQMLKDKEGEAHIKKVFNKGWNSFEQLWRDGKNQRGEKLQYYVTCYDPKTGNKNTDVWTNQLDALWYLISIGEEPFIPEDRARQILKTIYRNNRSFMGWAMCKTENGKPVESDQGKDVYTTSNYVLAQLLDYYGMVKESKDVYQHMDRVVFDYGNSMITADNLRAELEKEMGESKPGPHYIVAAYPRPGAVWTHLVMNHVKDLQAKTKSGTIESKDLMPFFPGLLSGPEKAK